MITKFHTKAEALAYVEQLKRLDIKSSIYYSYWRRCWIVERAMHQMELEE